MGIRSAQQKSAIVAALGMLGLATAGAIASMTLGAIGTLLDNAWASLTETEASIERDIADLEAQLALRRADLDLIRGQKDTVAEAQAEAASEAQIP